MRMMGKIALVGTMLASTAIALPAQAATTISLTANLGGSLAINGLYNGGTVTFDPQFVEFTGTSAADAATVFGDFSIYELSSLKLASSVNGSPGIVDFGSGYVYGSGTLNGAAVSGFGKLSGDILAAFSGANFLQGGTSPAPFTVTNAQFTTPTNGSVTFNSGNLLNTSVVTNVGAVPEPATWGMMILGFGLIGGAMRRRQRNVATTVRFA
jgi:hypothetical protein